MSGHGEGTKNIYRKQFTRLSLYLPQIVSDIEALRLVNLSDTVATGDLRTNAGGIEYSFQGLFTKNPYGKWVISNF